VFIFLIILDGNLPICFHAFVRNGELRNYLYATEETTMRLPA
jgi:hypothetical protein